MNALGNLRLPRLAAAAVQREEEGNKAHKAEAQGETQLPVQRQHVEDAHTRPHLVAAAQNIKELSSKSPQQQGGKKE